MGAGDYPDRLRWFVQSTTKDSVGQDVETFTDNGLLWGSISPNSGRRQPDYGATQTGWDAELRVRNMPALKTEDRLYAIEWDETYIIDTIVRGNNELVLQCVKFDTLGL
jgi:head-tail adaptor